MLVLALCATLVAAELPNLVYILNDDTDVLLGGAASLIQTRKLLGDAGADFTQFRTLSPKCTPSRTGQLAGRHYHNVRTRKNLSSVNRPVVPGGGLNQSTMFQADALFPMLHSHGYWTSAVGKIHNGQSSFLCKPGHNRTEYFTHVATLCKPCGNYWGNQYVVKEPEENTTRMEKELPPNAWSTYSHGQFGNRSVSFMKKAVAAGKPFFAYIGTTGE
jgi:arylsulfatase A-like enzyme